MRTLSRLAIIALASLIVPGAASGGGFCGPDTIRVSSHADTVFVSHKNARKQCCLELTVSTGYSEHVINFTEDDNGRICPCYCCYHHLYSAAGFPAGHYMVQVYELGSILYGEGEVDVTGTEDSPHITSIAQGDCVIPDPAREATWGLMRLLYR